MIWYASWFQPREEAVTDDHRFIMLSDEVERQGGELLPGICKGQHVTYKKGQHHVTHSQDALNTTGCLRQRRFQIPDQEPESDTALVAGVTVACANDDLMALWPRFSGMYEEEY